MSAEPYLRDADVELYCGDALEVLRTLPDRSVHMCATSPPFFGLRDYQCEGQIGLEESPDEWVARLVEVFREVRRVLRDDGTLWVEIGDSYCQGGHRRTEEENAREKAMGIFGDERGRYPTRISGQDRAANTVGPGRKHKDLLGQPWLLAFALRADGWYLRSEIIWARPNPMPESVTDRPTKAHSTVFLLSKMPRYYFDAEAIRQPFSGPDDPRKFHFRYGSLHAGGDDPYVQGAKSPRGRQIIDTPQTETLDGSDGEAPRGPDGRRATAVKAGENSEQHRDGERWPASGANARSVWTIPTEPTPFAHFATWPQKLVARMILAGTSERGVCPECGGPWVREVEREGSTWSDRVSTMGHPPRYGDHHAGYPQRHAALGTISTTTLGWRPSCSCTTKTGITEGGEAVGGGVVGVHAMAARVGDASTPATILDPFAGSGTTLLVARKLGRRAIGIELNLEYVKLATDRLAQQSLFADVTEVLA